MKVSNITNENGNPIKNQFIISVDNGDQVFQSYETKIAIYKPGGRVVLDKNALNYSRTTSKYLYRFLHMTRKEIESHIAAGRIELQDLNRGM